MRRGFSRDRKGRIGLNLDLVEVGLLQDLVLQLGELVDPGAPPEDPLAAMVGIDADAKESDDPALQRLFPAAYADDEAAAAEFRRFTERTLREGKASRAALVSADLSRLASDGGRGEITRDAANAWLGSLNDLRLVLASRLGVDDDEGMWRGRLEGDAAGEQAMLMYDWLTWLQDGLIDAMTR